MATGSPVPGKRTHQRSQDRGPEHGRDGADVGAEANKPSGRGDTPLEIAVQRGEPALFEALLEHGADPKQGAPLVFAYDYAYDKLLELGVDVNAASSGGWTPLMDAANGGNTERIKTLLARGARVNQKGDNDYTPLLLAAMSNRREAFLILLIAGADASVKDDEDRDVKKLGGRRFERLLNDEAAIAEARKKHPGIQPQ